MSSDPSTLDVWEFTRALSLRDQVRMAAQDAYGRTLNLYTRSRDAISADAPTLPWAVYLADDAGVFRLVVFDFDAKDDPAQAAKDADLLSDRLTEAGIDHVVCQSGPHGGRHVWVALTDGVPVDVMKAIADSVKALCPSLDKAPISNAATGCCRPPGAPHRDGGSSTVISGALATLLTPATTGAQLVAFAGALNAERPETQGATPAPGVLPVDVDGNPYLPGTKRDLPAHAAAALVENGANSPDASAVQWHVLIGAAAARWRFSDVLTHLATAPGLEHSRTIRHGQQPQGRVPRPAAAQLRLLRAEWARAVQDTARYVATSGDDHTFPERAGSLVDHLEHVQGRADASAGRWKTGGGPADRRVLDALATLALEAVQPSVEADIRRLAGITGLGRETVRVALQRLSADGWIAQTRAAEGSRAAHWTTDPQGALHRGTDTARSQVLTRPAGAAVRTRNTLLQTLRTRLTSARHDVFTGSPALGFHAGNVYARIQAQDPVAANDPALTKLMQYGFIRRDGASWAVCESTTLEEVALLLGVSGRLAQRAARYTTERELWAWWRNEHEWMTTTGKDRRRKRPTVQQVTLTLGRSWDIYPKYPRSGSKADHNEARQAVAAGALSHLDHHNVMIAA